MENLPTISDIKAKIKEYKGMFKNSSLEEVKAYCQKHRSELGYLAAYCKFSYTDVSRFKTKTALIQALSVYQFILKTSSFVSEIRKVQKQKINFALGKFSYLQGTADSLFVCRFWRNAVTYHYYLVNILNSFMKKTLKKIESVDSLESFFNQCVLDKGCFGVCFEMFKNFGGTLKMPSISDFSRFLEISKNYKNV